MNKVAVDDPEEMRYSQWILSLFDQAAVVDNALMPLMNPEVGSRLHADDASVPNYDVSGYAVGQLSAATGCIASLKMMVIQESDGKSEMVAGPFGAYALVRNALDAAAVALWLLDPVNGKLRVKRRLQLAVDEVDKSAAFRQAMGLRTTKAKLRARLKEVAVQAGLEDWNPLRNELPSTTKILKDIERLHSQSILPWLAAWQLASGHAHGKQWAYVASHELEKVKGTETEVGAHFQMTIHYGMLAALLFETVRLLETAATRYSELAKATPPPDSRTRKKPAAWL